MNKKKFLSAATLTAIAISHPNSGVPSSGLYSVLQSRNIIRNVPPSNEEFYEGGLSNILGEIFMDERERLARLEERVSKAEEVLKEFRSAATREDIRELRQEMKELFNKLENKISGLDSKIGENTQKLSEIQGGLKASKVLIPIIIGLLTSLITTAITLGLTFWKLIPYMIKSIQTLPKH